jgi:predicted MPP superfamily phosphohydrolase
VRETPLLLAGNERPWFGTAPNLANAPPPTAAGGPFRILLSHTPDQIAWARRNHFDLVLAGHTHGGQIRIPLAGPIVSPSRYGVRYASGTFFEGRTLMHVSRGLSGLHNLRWRCPPELALLELSART